jgi:hypothetical protein
MRQAEIDQHGFAAGTEHDAARLDIVMDDMLPMQIGKRRRSLAGDAHRLFKWERQIGEPAVQRLSGDPLDHDVRLAREVAGAETDRHMRFRQPRQDHLLHLEANDGGRNVALGYGGDFSSAAAPRCRGG